MEPCQHLPIVNLDRRRLMMQTAQQCALDLVNYFSQKNLANESESLLNS